MTNKRLRTFHVYEVFKPAYILCVCIAEETFGVNFNIDIDTARDHYRIGTIDAYTPQDAIHHIADDEWLYLEHNTP